MTAGAARADRTPYAAGIGILANSWLEVRHAGYRRLCAQAGVDDSARDRTHGARGGAALLPSGR